MLKYVEGHEEGHKAEIIDTLTALVKDGFLSVKEASKRANRSEAEFNTLLAAHS